MQQRPTAEYRGRPLHVRTHRLSAAGQRQDYLSALRIFMRRQRRSRDQFLDMPAFVLRRQLQSGLGLPDAQYRRLRQ